MIMYMFSLHSIVKKKNLNYIGFDILFSFNIIKTFELNIA